jgi:hypothetical protein
MARLEATPKIEYRDARAAAGRGGHLIGATSFGWGAGDGSRFHLVARAALAALPECRMPNTNRRGTVGSFETLQWRVSGS